MRLNHIPHCTKTVFFATLCISLFALAACSSRQNSSEDRLSPADVPKTHPAMQHNHQDVLDELSDDAQRVNTEAENIQ